jgi:hypothetical protein
MSEPYEGGECPVCGSTNTGSYKSDTAAMQGFGSRCYDCRAVWDFPKSVDQDDYFSQSFADAIWSGTQQVKQHVPANKNTVNPRLTSKSARPAVENDAYAAFTRRVLRAYARRVATGDVEALTRMTDLAEDIDAAIRYAITGLRTYGYSWADIGRQLGVTRQAAQQRWGLVEPASNRTTPRKEN